MIHLRSLVLLLLAVAGPSALADEPVRSIEGRVTYLARIALPPEARLVVEARGLDGVLLGETRSVSEGAQVPLPFALTIPERVAAELRAALFIDGQARWVSDVVEVAPGDAPVDLGEILLNPYTPMGFTSTLRCGAERVRIGFAGERALLDLAGRVLELDQAIAASGARYTNADESVVLWIKGDTARVELDGTALPACVPVPPEADAGWRAQGNEPGWSLRLQGDRMTLTTDLGASTLEARLPQPEIADGGFRYVLADDGIRLTIVEQICRDSMTGMPHPQRVRVDARGEPLQGCGGDPLRLLTGREWTVEDISGQGIIDRSHVTLLFDRNGALSGSGGCNRYHGQAQLTGERLTIGPLGSTMMACSEALMNQERTFFNALARVDAFDIDDSGALHLRGGGESLILARH
ncbi:META domain-containing protein [Thiohalocapsa marina]|nr:META domain-containing protein [Thiohalocapsa marina]